MVGFLPDYVTDNPGAALAVAVVIVGLLAFGYKDALRLSPTRLWAISTVALRQALRRRVLWITPLLMLGIVIVSQLQKSIDAQDAIRQTAMVSLYATGLLVVLLTIILAATNLPREIENRVIYTIATKPATRLEIVLGKVVGFARVSCWLLAIMGLFTYGYRHLRDYGLRRELSAQLAAGAVDSSIRPTLEYYRDHGLLHAREMGIPSALNIYSHRPQQPGDRWSPGGLEGEMFIRFTVDRRLLPPPDSRRAVVLQVPVLVRRLPGAGAPATQPTTQPTTQPAEASVNIALFDATMSAVITNRELGQPQSYAVPEPGRVLQLAIPSELLGQVLPRDPRAVMADILLQIVGVDARYEYSTDLTETALIVPETSQAFSPFGGVAFQGRQGVYGQQLRGGPEAGDRVAIYRFSGQKPAGGASPTRLLELRLGVERVEDEQTTHVLLDVHNRVTGHHAANLMATVETNRPAYVDVPAEAVDSGDFEVIVRTPSNAWLGLRAPPAASVRLVKQDEPFAWNLAKSLLVLWLMSLLVATVAIFASTFLSWPIAVVLTVVILCGRWTARQVADVQGASYGRQIVNDLMPGDINAASARAVSESVDALVTMLNTVAAVLPDISQYAAIEPIQNGESITPAAVLAPALKVTAGFGLPLLVLAYIFLRYKEVAP